MPDRPNDAVGIGCDLACSLFHFSLFHSSLSSFSIKPLRIVVLPLISPRCGDASVEAPRAVMESVPGHRLHGPDSARPSAPAQTARRPGARPSHTLPAD